MKRPVVQSFADRNTEELFYSENKGEFSDFHFIRTHNQWRIVFRWTDDGPHRKALVDYH